MGKPSASRSEGSRSAIVLFASFADGDAADTAPAWAAGLFDPTRPGSFSHFYDTMSFGKLQVRGDVAPRRYRSLHSAEHYLASDPTDVGGYGEFCLEILEQADADIDLSRYDNDGPDGLPNSGDDDGIADAVFVIVASSPVGFFKGASTGVDRLGFRYLDEGLRSRLFNSVAYVTDDAGVDGEPILVSTDLGSVLRGRSFVEAAGSMCHEYGHLLGLPDLYSVGFLGEVGAPPERDSAGVGNWGLMGWGADGWTGTDGPAGFSAWSRVTLGWSPVEAVAMEVQQVEFEDVSAGGAVLKVPITDTEHFLLEYRRRGDHYYERGIPAEGVLIWHVVRLPSVGEHSPRVAVDLECADGRWQEGGFPLGWTPDPWHGGDNLDYWAHDSGYSQSHAGNLGDATDPFGATTVPGFTPETNPNSCSEDGQGCVRISDIRLDDAAATAMVRPAPPRLTVEEWVLSDESGDGVLVAGEEGEVHLWLANRGGRAAGEVRSVLASSNEALEVLLSETRHGDLSIGDRTAGHPAVGSDWHRIRAREELAGSLRAELEIVFLAEDVQVGQHSVTVDVVSARQRVEAVEVVDTLGNDDGRVQAGEFLRLAVTLAGEGNRALAALKFDVRSLDATMVRQLGGTVMTFATGGGAPVRTVHSPEFLVSSSVVAGTALAFELWVRSGRSSWRDTVSVSVAEGPDGTPPRVALLRATADGPGNVAFTLSDRWVLEGGVVTAAVAHVYALADTVLAATVPLRRTGDRFVGEWDAAVEGEYLLIAEVVDEAGNHGRGAFQHLALSPDGELGSPETAGIGWEPVDVQLRQGAVGPIAVAMAPSDARTWYATSLYSLWRSGDAGESWRRLPYMFDGFQNVARIHVDWEDASTLYVLDDHGQAARSRDGGMTWENLEAGREPWHRWRIDQMPRGRSFASSGNELLISDDGARTWRQVDTEARWEYAFTHPADTSVIYAVATWGQGAGLYHSADAGVSWQRQELDGFSWIIPDPHDAGSLYAAAGTGIWHTRDQGQTWVSMGPRTDVPLDRVLAHPGQPGLLYAWRFGGGAGFWRSFDGGGKWEALLAPSTVQDITIHPMQTESLCLVVRGNYNSLRRAYRSADYGERFVEVTPFVEDSPVGALAFAPDKALVATATVISDDGNTHSGLVATDGADRWRWLPVQAGTAVWEAILDVLFIDPGRPEVMLTAAGHTVHSLHRTDDGGQTWARPRTGWVTSTSALRHVTLLRHPSRPGVYYLGDGDIWLSGDFGESWHAPSVPPPSRDYGIDPIELAMEPEGGIFAALGDTLWLSQDEGSTWDEVGRVGVVPFSDRGKVVALACDPGRTGQLFACTQGRLWVSEDRGRSWRGVLAPAVGDWLGARIRFDPHDPSRMYLVTPRHLYESSDAGETWAPLVDDIGPRRWFNDLSADPWEAGVLYAATTWGLYRLDRRVPATVVDVSRVPLPVSTRLEQNYPNPFNVGTVIRFSLPAPTEVELVVFDLVGQRVRTLVSPRLLEAGEHSTRWDGSDHAGHSVGSGVYLYELRCGSGRQVQKLLMLK